MSNSRVWLFRGLVIVAAGLLLLSWFLNWWSADIETVSIKDAIVIHPYGLVDKTGISILIGVTMPSFFTPLMWTYLGLVVAALLIGAWLKDKNVSLFRRKFNLSRWLVGIVGFSYIVVVVLAVIVAAIKTGEVGGLHLLGRTFIRYSKDFQSWVDAKLLFGYWLACGVGPLLIVLALLRNKIIGRTKPD